MEQAHRPSPLTLAALGDTIRFQAQAFTAQGGVVAGVPSAVAPQQLAPSRVQEGLTHHG
jgi:hypothetical protein